MHLEPVQFQRWALDEIRRHVAFDFAIWGTGDGQSRELHTATILDQTDTLFDTWEAVKEEDLYAHLVIGNTGKTWSLNQIPNIYQSRAYNEHWRLYQARQMISTMEIDPHTGLHIFVTLARDHRYTGFSAREVEFKNLVTQHLFLAACNNDKHYLSTFRAPAALVDTKGLLHAVLPDFTTLVTHEWGPSAHRQLPQDVILSLWASKRYRGKTITLTSERVGARLLVCAQPGVVTALSKREKEVAWAYAQGQSHKHVARTLNISPTTVRSHISRIYQKLGVRDKGALALWLQEHG
ncbi:hypothetical protein GCM10007426_09880 [Alloalcanivorax dieselolei]|nr:hypothetical protein GCM10007426_09880 [Alloalcanivorax dieselolei]